MSAWPLAALSIDAPPSRIRVSHIWGHGSWFDASERPRLERWVRDLNANLGAGTHWIETEG